MPEHTPNAGLRSVLKSLYQSLRLVAQAAPTHLCRLLFLNLIFGASPALMLYFQKIVIDEITVFGAAAQPTSVSAWMGTKPLLLGGILGFIFINLLLDSIETIAGFEAITFRDSVQGKVKAQVYEKVANFDDIALFENPALLNTLQLALAGINRVNHLTFTVGNLLTGIFSFVPMFLLSFSIAWWIPLCIILFSIPSIYVQLRYEGKSWGVEYAQAHRVRQMQITEQILTQSDYAKELRLLRLQSFFLEQWRTLFWSAFGEMNQIRRQGTLAILGWSLLSGIGVTVPFIYIVWATINGAYTLGDLALYGGLVFQARRSLYVLMSNATNLHSTGLATQPIFELLALTPTLQTVSLHTMQTVATGTSPASQVSDGIVINDLSFAYPGNRKPVLKNVTFTIQPGQTVAIVGENGAGKTTLVKLLCRLYDPQSGAIYWHGQDIRTVALPTHYQNVAILMQDYTRFPATIRENIGFGLLAKLDDESAILQAAEKSGLQTLVQSFAQALDTPLTKALENGTELSGGQWQRVALARALLRHPQAKLLILDEPTAAIDPKTEHEIYKVLREMAQDKMTIFISHRLALTRAAHQIIVMEQGEIVERGTHQELMAMQGLYQTMFHRQSERYH